MNVDNKARLEPADLYHSQQNTYFVRDVDRDEIDLGDLLQNLINEWKLMAMVMVIGALCSIAIAWLMPRVYLVESKLRVPSIHELGDISGQSIIKILPADALKKVIDQILMQETQGTTLEGTELEKVMSGNEPVPIIELSRSISKSMKAELVERDYLQLGKNEKIPFEEMSISLESRYPELASDYLRKLVKMAHRNALTELSNDVRAIKASSIRDLQEQLRALALAGEQSREAEIARLQEKNLELIDGIQLEIESMLIKARRDRENRIIRLGEASQTAERLEIWDPVTWDDLRPLRKSAQINNELGDRASDEPLYFRGTRLLQAELDQLKARKDDRPFVEGITELEHEIDKLKNDPKIVALKSRVDDSIYIEKYDDLQRQLTGLQNQPVEFKNARLAIVSQPAFVHAGPIRNPMIYIVIGGILSGIVALLVVIIRISLRNSKVQSVTPSVESI